jgi:hypothetical protein
MEHFITPGLLVLLVIVLMILGFDRLGCYLRRRRFIRIRLRLSRLVRPLTGWWRWLRSVENVDINLGAKRMINRRRIYLISVVVHAVVLLLVCQLVVSVSAPEKSQFVSQQETKAPMFVEPQQEEPVTPVPDVASGSGETDGGNDIQLPPNQLTNVTLIPDSLISAKVPTRDPVLPSNSSGKVFQFGATGYGSGNGNGFGKGNGTGKGSGLTLGDMEVPSDVAVVLDISGSMDAYLKSIRAQLKEQFADVPIFNADNSVGRLSKNSSSRRSQFSRMFGNTTNLYDAIYMAAKSRWGLEAIYVLSDFQDGYDEEDTRQLIQFLSERQIKLYLCYIDRSVKPFPPLEKYAQGNGASRPFSNRLR